MVHTYTMRKSKRYRYYVCYNAQQQGWKNCETKSVSAQAIETAVLDSIRRIGTDPKLAEAVAAEALEQMAQRRRAHRPGVGDPAAKPPATQPEPRARRRPTPAWTPARGSIEWPLCSGRSRPRSAGWRNSPPKRGDLDRDHINADDLRRTLAEFDAIWASMTTKEQEQMIHLLVAKVGYDGRTGKVTVNFSNAGAKELCQGKC